MSQAPPYRPEELPFYLTVAHMIECGLLHTGLPSCCVAFYVHEWILYEQAERDAYRKLKNAQKHVGYVRCPRCLSRDQKVPVKPCACEEHFNAGSHWQYRKDSGQVVPVPGHPNAWTAPTGKKK